MKLHVGAVWKDGVCVICSAEGLQNCPEDRCTADLHDGALHEIWVQAQSKALGKKESK